MTITFIPEARKQRYLLMLLGAVLVGALGLVWYKFFRETPVFTYQTQPPPPREIQIDFSVFEDPAFRELGAARPAIPFPSEVGKRNPFFPIP